MELAINTWSAPDRFLSMSGVGDNGVTYAPGRNQPGKCTRWNWLALGAFANTTTLYSAIDAWNATPVEHRHAITDSTVVPRGFIVVLGAADGPRWAGDENWRYGDFVMALGEGAGLAGRVRSTDSLSGSGRIGDMTIAERARQTGRKVLGYISSVGGWLLHSNAPSGANTEIEEEDMAEPTVVVWTNGVTKNVGEIDGAFITFGTSAAFKEFLALAPKVKKIHDESINKLVTKAVAK